MENLIVIFSSDSIRGKIINNALTWHGYHVRLFDKLYETEAAVNKYKPVVVVVDTFNCMSKCILFIKTLNFEFPGVLLITIVEPWNVSDLESHGMYGKNSYIDPFDPEQIADNIKNYIKEYHEVELEVRSKSEYFDPDNIDHDAITNAINAKKDGNKEVHKKKPKKRRKQEVSLMVDGDINDIDIPPFFQDSKTSFFQKVLDWIKNF